MVTDAIPYVESGQLKGILAGMPGAAEYEKLVYDYLVDKYSSDNPEIEKGRAFARMSAQSVAHLLMVIFIILGNLSYYFERKKVK